MRINPIFVMSKGNNNNLKNKDYEKFNFKDPERKWNNENE